LQQDITTSIHTWTFLKVTNAVICSNEKAICQKKGLVMPALRLTRTAFLLSQPPRCLRCYREGVVQKDVDLENRTRQGVSTLHCDVAMCMHEDCGAVYAQIPKDVEGSLIDAPWLYCRKPVVFRSGLPYHIALGAAVSEALSLMEFASEHA